METPVNPESASTAPAVDAIDPGPMTFGRWISNNTGPLIAIGGLAALIVWKGLNLWDMAKVALGLGLVIFIHELGHFLAAKWCDVHVDMFAIGFGQPLPGCQFKYGETTYKIGWIPLGGFVKMVGEGDNADTEEAEEDPRSFKNKSVGQRMLIISAGVFMNMILAVICFMFAYSHGVEERSPGIGWVEVGSPSWQSGMTSGTTIQQIGSIKKPMFDDIRPIVMGSDKGEKIPFVIVNPFGEQLNIEVEPSRDDEALFPTIGVAPAKRLVLSQSNRKVIKPYQPGSAAAAAEPKFEPGDHLVGCSVSPTEREIKPLPAEANPSDPPRLDFAEFYRRQTAMRGLPMDIEVVRAAGGEHVKITVPPAFTLKTGMLMQMGRVASVRNGSPAAEAVAADSGEIGFRVRESTNVNSGDKILEVEVKDGAESRKWSIKPANGAEVVLDPLKLPFELESWFEKKRTDLTVRFVVLRQTGHAEERVSLAAKWDERSRFNREMLQSLNAPLSIPCLGLAYHVDAVVEAVDANASQAGVLPGDVIVGLHQNGLDNDGVVKDGKWSDVKPHQWASVFSYLQTPGTPQFTIRVQRGTAAPIEVKMTLEEDKTWPAIDRGLYFQDDTRMQKADSLSETIGLGLHRTWRTVRVIYQNLYAMFTNRVSPLTMSGPLTIATVSYNIAGENIWQFILFLGMINVNLAIINFLPIPILDGGHMVFLIYEKIRGKPAPDWAQVVALWIGLAFILGLMCFVLFLDVKRLF